MLQKTFIKFNKPLIKTTQKNSQNDKVKYNPTTLLNKTNPLKFLSLKPTENK